MYELFELVRLLSVRRQTTRQGPVEIKRFTWRENGECSLLVLLCSNDQLLVRWSVSGHAPVVKQLPWAPEKGVAAMCLDPTVAWLLVVTETPCLYILPAVTLMDPSARVNQLWSVNDCTVIPLTVQGIVCAACWWHTFDDRQVAIVATKVGELLFVDLLSQKVVSKVTTDIQVCDLTLIHDDDQMSTYLLMTGVSSGQWKMLLEAKTNLSHFSPDTDLSDMGYINIDSHTIPPVSVLDTTDESAAKVFAVDRIPHSHPWVVIEPQNARGRHFLTAHDQKTATLQVYDSEIQFSPLFVYKLPPGAESVILTDRLTFTLSRRNGCQVLILSNQRAETSMETMADFNDDAVIQKLELPAGEKMLGARHRTFPFYWHDKQEEQQRIRLRQGTVLEQPAMDTVAMEPEAFDIPITTHTVLDGCIVVTDSAVYECRPRASPERLFLQHTLVSAEMGVAEHLAISVGLDITLLAELAAVYLLRIGRIARAIRLYALSKCSQSKRCASLARYGCVQDVVVLLKQTLQNPSLDLASSDRKVLADMLLHCYVQMVAHGTPNTPQFMTGFREFLLGSFAFDENVALDLLAEFGLNSLLLDFAMGRGLVADALGRLVTKGRLPVSLTLLTQLVTRGFSAHVLQAAQGGVLSSLLGEALTEVLVTQPELVTCNVPLIKRHIASLELPVLLRLAAILDPSQGAVYSLVRRQTSSLHRSSSLSSVASFASTIGEIADANQDGASLLSLSLEVFLLIVLYINHHRGYQEPFTPELFLSDPTQGQNTESVDKGSEETGLRSLALQFGLVSCGSHHTAVVRNGDLYTWGRTAHGRLGQGHLVKEEGVSGPACVQAFHLLHIRVEAVACGGEHTLAITQQGVYGWGNSRYGQVGVGTRHVYHRPMLLESLLSHTCVAVYCGQYHSLAVTADCRVWSWGWGVHGQLGHGDPEDRLQPKCIQSLSSRNITKAAAGYCHSLVLTELGEVWSFGCGYFGQLGIEETHKRTSPILISAFSEPVTAIGTKYFHSVAVTVSNRVYTWGCHPHNLRYAANALRRSRQMSHLSTPVKDGMELFQLPLPVDTTFIHSRVVQVSCGSLHTCLLTIDGEVYVWGRNLEGQLGTGTRQDERVPKMLTRINDQHIIHLSCGGEFNMALDADFSLWAWGKNDAGQLGLVKKDGGQSPWLQSSLVTMDVVVPMVHRGLPPFVLSAQTRWCSGNLQGPSARVQSTQWVEEEAGVGDEVILPSLQHVGHSRLPYPKTVIALVVKHLGHYTDTVAIFQHCVDLEDWVTAAYLCALEDRHDQALLYKLLGLKKAASDVSSESFADLSAEVVLHHLRLILEDKGSEHQLFAICMQMTDHWLDHQLPIAHLQQVLEPHLSQLVTNLATLLFRYERCVQGRNSTAQPYCQYFTAPFCLQVMNMVINSPSPASFKLLSSWLPQQLQTTGREEPVEMTGKRAGTTHQGKLLTPVLQSEDNLIPYQRVWQDIFRSVTKSPSSSTIGNISLTRSQLDHLTVHSEGDDASILDKLDDKAGVVLFTCGHHFTEPSFMHAVLDTCLRQLEAGSSHLSSDRLPATAAVLRHFYQQQELLPLACPKCVLNVLST